MTSFLSKNIDWETTLTGEALLLGLLSKILYAEPELEWLVHLSEEGVFLETPFAETNPDAIAGLELLQQWSKGFQTDKKKEMDIDLKADYMRIMVGTDNFNTPPWESVYFDEDRGLFQEETLAVRNWYRRFGLASEKIYNEPDDHIALEISFIAHLASQGLDALQKNDEKSLEKHLQAQHDFLKEHLLQWGPKWCDLVIENAHTDFYKGCAQLLRGALTELRELFDLEVSR